MDFITNLPLQLNRLKNPVKKLYYKGNLELLNFPKIAVVGSRKCIPYTKNLILNLTSTLKKYRICTISGAAIGTDIYAHQGAFPHTIAVFGNGLNEIYPPSNAKIIKEIYKNSLALSEYEPNLKAAPWTFLNRNRIVVGLCEAVVIAQADLKSGSMASARFALDMNIPLFVLPQRLEDSYGTNTLLYKKQASIIVDFDEFAMKFASNFANEIKHDEIIEFIKQNSNFDDCYTKFGDILYEYELDGKIAIDGIYIRAL